MRGIKSFKGFEERRIVKKQSPDASRAEFLMGEAERGYNNLLKMIEKIGIAKDNANDFVKNCHDIIMELIRAKMHLDGYNASGFGAHEAEVAYLRILKFSEHDIQFADQLRFFRNGMLYYGTMLDKEYAEKVIIFTNKIYKKLEDMLPKK